VLSLPLLLLMSGPNKRRDTDVMKLMMSDFAVQLGGDAHAAPQSDFYVRFTGPPASPYEGGIWRVHVVLPAQYPFKSPSIGFCNTIFHPNVDEASGSVCLDVINQTWSPMFDLTNVFSVFLPQLLLYPNASDPLNAAAATLALRDKAAYEAKVREYVTKFASKDFKLSNDDDDERVDARSRSNAAAAAAGGGGAGSSSSSSKARGAGAKTSDHDDKPQRMDEEEELSDVDDECEDGTEGDLVF